MSALTPKLLMEGGDQLLQVVGQLVGEAGDGVGLAGFQFLLKCLRYCGYRAGAHVRRCCLQIVGQPL